MTRRKGSFTFVPEESETREDVVVKGADLKTVHRAWMMIASLRQILDDCDSEPYCNINYLLACVDDMLGGVDALYELHK